MGAFGIYYKSRGSLATTTILLYAFTAGNFQIISVTQVIFASTFWNDFNKII